MLSPLDALSLAGTILQFVDFSSKVLSHSHQLYYSQTGALPANQILELASTDLFALSQKLPKPLYGQSIDELCGSRESGTEDERALQKLAIACSEISVELSTKLNKLKVRGKQKKWSSFRQALKSAWSEEEMRGLTQRLSMCRDSLQMHIVVGLRNHIDTMAMNQSRRFDALDSTTQSIITALLGKEGMGSSAIKDQTMAITQILGRVELIAESQKCISDAIESLTKNNGGLNGTDCERVVSTEQLYKRFQESESEIRLRVVDDIIDSLWFAAIAAREEAIADAHRETFKWIFKKQTESLPWDSIAEWLHRGSGVYWVNGKAASGKSTFMRFIHDHPTTIELLENWASPLPLTTARFYFWNSGTLEQRSQSGLLRALLSEVLKRHKDLVPIVFPLRWARRYTELVEIFNYSGLDHRTTSASPDSWSLPELTEAFHKLVNHQIDQFKLCLFIDGLDEYEGDYEKMAALFNNISNTSCLKICVSSRPLLVFDDAFRSVPSLRLQDLTFTDINDYTTSSFYDNIHFKRLAEKEPIEALELVRDLVSRANGVFLWVKLVVLDLLRGLSNRDGLLDLRQRLDWLPADLEELFKSMLSKIEPFYLDKAAEIFLVARAARVISKGASANSGPFPTKALDTLTLSLAVDPDGDLLTKARSGIMNIYNDDWRHQQISAQLKVRCAGLLEADKGLSFASHYAVRYLHRTVREYLDRPDVLEGLVDRTTKTGFESNTAVLRSYVIQLMTFDRSLLTPNILQVFETSALLYAHEADKAHQIANTESIDLLDATILTLLKSQPGLDSINGYRLAS